MTISLVKLGLIGEGGDAKKANDLAMSLKLTPSIVLHRVSSFVPEGKRGIIRFGRFYN